MPTTTSVNFAPSTDGFPLRDPASETFAQIIAGAQTGSDFSDTTVFVNLLAHNTTANRFIGNRRGIFSFNTSTLPDDCVVTAVTLKLRGTSKTNNFGGSPVLHVVSASGNGYTNTGSVSFGSVTYAAFSTAGYNNIALNAAGIATINPTGTTRFGVKNGWDLSGSFGGTWSAAGILGFNIASLETAGTTSDPILTVEYYLTTTPSNSTHAVTSDNVTLIPTLTPQDATHAHTAQPLSLTPHLSPSDTVHAHTAEEPETFKAATPQSTTHGHTADMVVLDLKLFRPEPHPPFVRVIDPAMTSQRKKPHIRAGGPLPIAVDSSIDADDPLVDADSFDVDAGFMATSPKVHVKTKKPEKPKTFISKHPARGLQ